jgi:hypothetical protein
MESPQALIAPLERGSGGIKKERAERQGLVQNPDEKNKTRAVSPLWGNIVALSLPLYRGSKRNL